MTSHTQPHHRVFVTGGTGAIGRFVIPELVRAGHTVTAMARNDEKAAWLESLGAPAERWSLCNRDGLRSAFAGHDVVANLATSIPPMSQSMKPSAWTMNSRIRTEGSTAVVDA